VITAQATASGSGFVGTAPPALVTVATQMGELVLDQSVSVDGSNTTTISGLGTLTPNELLLAFVASDGPQASQSQSVTVSAPGLGWALVSRADAQAGTAEIWAATAPSSPLTNVTVTSTPAKAGYNQSMTILELHGASGVASVGAHASTGAALGAPTVSLTTIGNGSWVAGVGNDWDQAIARTLGPNQQLLHQRLITNTGDTFWALATTGVAPSSGTLVTLNDTAPTSDRWNFSAVEVVTGGTPPPPPPPVVQIASPVTGQTLSGSVTVSANATASAGLNAVNPVLFFLDGTTNQLPGPVTSNGPLFSTVWDTTRVANGTHSISAIATDTNNSQTTATVSGLIVANPPPPMGCFIVDRTVAAHGRGPVTTPATGFNTALPGELLLAFVGPDGPSNIGRRVGASGVARLDASF
jgi:hypothetical protein